MPDFGRISEHVIKQLEISFMETNGAIPITEMARKFNLSRSSFYRKLESEKTSYRELVELTRKNIVQELLREKRLSLSEISYTLGYANTTALNRAFKRWFNISVSEYKRNLECKNNQRKRLDS